MQTIRIEDHEFLDVRALFASFPAPLDQLSVPAWVQDEQPPSECIAAGEERRSSIRSMLRKGGYKPSGRGKPSSEYLQRLAASGSLPAINLAVDLGNRVSLVSGWPISVVDADRLVPPLQVSVSGPDRYVFNLSGQEIDLRGLVCLSDQQGPCANAVKDSQRTKTSPESSSTVSIIWGARAMRGDLDATLDWYMDMLRRAGAEVQPLPCCASN